MNKPISPTTITIYVIFIILVYCWASSSPKGTERPATPPANVWMGDQ